MSTERSSQAMARAGSDRSPSVSDQRTANLIGALALAVSDRLYEAIGKIGAGGPSASAALTALITYQEVWPSAIPVISIERLRRIVGLSHSATVRLVDRLCDEGLLERHQSLDGREAALGLTAEGKRAATRIISERQRLLDGVLLGLNSRERRALGRALEKMLAGMTSGRWEARNICRLCDHRLCHPNPSCPVGDAATALGQ